MLRHTQMIEKDRSEKQDDKADSKMANIPCRGSNKYNQGSQGSRPGDQHPTFEGRPRPHTVRPGRSTGDLNGLYTEIYFGRI